MKLTISLPINVEPCPPLVRERGSGTWTCPEYAVRPCAVLPVVEIWPAQYARRFHMTEEEVFDLLHTNQDVLHERLAASADLAAKQVSADLSLLIHDAAVVGINQWLAAHHYQTISARASKTGTIPHINERTT